MATYELYQGGVRQQNANWQMLPAAPYSQSQTFVPVVKQFPIAYFLSRTYNFGFTGAQSDSALDAFVANQATISAPLASGDKLGSIVIPTPFLAEGFYWSVNNALAGGQFAVDTRIGATSLLVATSTGTVSSAYVVWPSGPILYKAGAGDIIEVVLTTIPAGGLAGLSLTVGVLGRSFQNANS
ncbi:MAG: hypothetical protein ACREQ5_13095 [Candidatus Dormibacteria bacterium]